MQNKKDARRFDHMMLAPVKKSGNSPAECAGSEEALQVGDGLKE